MIIYLSVHTYIYTVLTTRTIVETLKELKIHIIIYEKFYSHVVRQFYGPIDFSIEKVIVV